MIAAMLLIASGGPIVLDGARRATAEDQLTASGMSLSCAFTLDGTAANLAVLLNGKVPTGKHDSLQVLSNTTTDVSNIRFSGERMSRDEKLPIGSQVFYMAHNLTFDIGWQKFAAELAYDYGQDEVRPGEIYDVAHLRNLRLKIYRRKDAGFRYGFLTPKDGRVKSAITVNCSASSTANPLGGKSL